MHQRAQLGTVGFQQTGEGGGDGQPFDLAVGAGHGGFGRQDTGPGAFHPGLGAFHPGFGGGDPGRRAFDGGFG